MTSSANDRLAELRATLEQFNAERDWAQFHTLRSLVLALSSEVGELSAEVRWLSEGAKLSDLDEQARSRIVDEIGDVALVLLNLSRVAGVDIVEAAEQKLAKNGVRYPVETSRGRAGRPK